MTAISAERHPIPHTDDDYSRSAAARRLEFVRAGTRAGPRAPDRLFLRPGRAGRAMSRTSSAWRRCRSGSPVRSWSNGEHASGEFYVPLATTEGTLVASYNRGMKLLHRAGGVTTTVMDDVMQRAPAFGFDSARQARAFGEWVTLNFDAIARAAEADDPDRTAA